MYTSAIPAPIFSVCLLPHQQGLRRSTQRPVGLCRCEGLEEGLISGQQRQGCQVQVLGRQDQERVAWPGSRQQSWAAGNSLLQACSRSSPSRCRAAEWLSSGSAPNRARSLSGNREAIQTGCMAALCMGPLCVCMRRIVKFGTPAIWGCLALVRLAPCGPALAHVKPANASLPWTVQYVHMRNSQHTRSLLPCWLPALLAA